jgi:hypothetical protein
VTEIERFDRHELQRRTLAMSGEKIHEWRRLR